MYNYLEAFNIPPQLSEDQLKEIALAATFLYFEEFPEAQGGIVAFYMETKHVEVTGGPEPRLYSWKQLGFEL